MQKFKSMCVSAIVPTIVSALIFFLNYFCFGMENIMIAPFATLAFLRFRNMTNHYACMGKNYLIFLAMTGLAFVASINLPLCILVNAFAFFWLAYSLIDEYNPVNYFPAGMALIFFQMKPVADLAGLANRAIALSASMLIVFVFIAILAYRSKSKDPIADNIRLGLANCQNQMHAYLEHDTTKLDVLHQELRAINSRITDEIYHYNRSTMRAVGRINWYCRYVALFQVINYFTSQDYNEEEYQTIADTLQRFTRQFETVRPTADYKQLHFRNNKPSRQSFRFRFAMRLLIVMTPCMAFASAADLENSFWLVISVFFMMIPVSDNTKNRVKQRVLGTCAGIVICFVLFSIFTQFPGRAALMLLSNFMIYASTSYAMMVTYITCSALAIQTIDAAIGVVLWQRLLYTLIGAVIAVLANKCIFQIRTRKEMVILIERLDGIRNELVNVSDETYPDPDERQHYTDELVIKSYMLMKRLQTYNATISHREKEDPSAPDSFAVYEKKYMGFMAAYLKDHLLEKMPL
ncbi:MAG: FUSC family protein [Eubacterium sp.]|nr:FUSC family protein [Eubacterium sp.]